MTGYGLGRATREHLTVTVEVKTLNSKGLEFHMRLPSHYLQQELMLKNLLTPYLIRGKVTVMVQVQNAMGESFDEAANLNTDVLKAYFHRLRGIHTELGIAGEPRLESLLNLPGVQSDKNNEISELENLLLEEAGKMAAEGVVKTRQQEGAILADELRMRGIRVGEYLQQVEPLEQPRIDAVRQRLNTAMAELPNTGNQQRERLEQEILFYLEKLDITEEKVRFRAHQEHFLRLLDDKESQGRKLVFVVQELWREANTLGNKASEFNMQTLVVQIKDELEKVKEQLMNVL